MPSSATGPEGLVPSLIPVVDGISGPWGLMALLLYVTFVLHLLLMNALVGTAILALIARLKARKTAPLPAEAELARDTDILLPKGVAFVVNLGVPPFLFLQSIYGQYIYSSSVLMAFWWLSVMLVVMLAYYGFYLNMARRGLSEGARSLALGLAVLLLLWNAFLFVNNMTLMQNPEAWQVYGREAGGTFLNLGEPQLLPRYLHVILSCLAVGGLCLALPSELALRGKGGNGEEEALRERRNRGLHWFAAATLAQIPVGLWFFMALPGPQRALFMGGSGTGSLLFCLSLLLTCAALAAAWKKRTVAAAVCCVPLVAFMAGMRTLLRSSYLEPWYEPAINPFDVGPLMLFVVSLVLSGVGLFFMLRMYLRHHDEGRAAPETPEMAQLRRRELRDMLLVNEIAGSKTDLPAKAAGAGKKGGVRP